MSDTTTMNAIDERLAAALEASNYRVTLQLQKNASKLKLKSDLTFSINGGIFTADRDLISFVSALLNLNKQEAVLLDNNDNPIKIDNLKNFLEELVELYNAGMDEHLKEYNRLKSARTTSKVVTW
jgi:hypothetical protein